ncbi:hypothetical protein BgiBS90_004058, partial [Biomphalaria glabrata]
MLYIFKAQNTKDVFFSKSVVCEGDPVTIICGTRHFYTPSATLLCTKAISLKKLDEKSGEFILLVEYSNRKIYNTFI